MQAKTLIVDEIYFLGASDVSVLSEYCSIAKGISEHPFGQLNLVTCGDPCQLPPPKAMTLFNWGLVNCYKSNTLNAGNENIQYSIKGIEAWHQIDHVITLNEIMRQKGDDIRIDILSRLCKGVCTQAEKDILDTYVLSDERCTEETKVHTGIQHWINGKGAP